jgi:hypothetical protein
MASADIAGAAGASGAAGAAAVSGEAAGATAGFFVSPLQAASITAAMAAVIRSLTYASLNDLFAS